MEDPPKKKTRRPIRRDDDKRRVPFYVWVVLGVALLMAGGIAVYRAQPAGPTEHSRLVGIAEAVIQSSLTEDGTPKFSSDQETSVESLGGGKYYVIGWVDLVSDYRPTRRHTFSCVIFQSDGGTWQGEQITILPKM